MNACGVFRAMNSVVTSASAKTPATHQRRRNSVGSSFPYHSWNARKRSLNHTKKKNFDSDLAGQQARGQHRRERQGLEQRDRDRSRDRQRELLVQLTRRAGEECDRNEDGKQYQRGCDDRALNLGHRFGGALVWDSSCPCSSPCGARYFRSRRWRRRRPTPLRASGRRA